MLNINITQKQAADQLENKEHSLQRTPKIYSSQVADHTNAETIESIFCEQINIPICKIEAKFNKQPERRVHNRSDSYKNGIKQTRILGKDQIMKYIPNRSISHIKLQKSKNYIFTLGNMNNISSSKEALK